MSTEDNSTQVSQAKPTPELKSLDRLIGTWQITGGATGQIHYEWMDGGFFLMQKVDLMHYDNHNVGMEIIGHEHFFGSEPSTDIKSRYYGSTGETFDYVYELEGDTLTIWGGEKGSPAYYKGTFNEDDSILSGEWVYPGGGYDSIATRIK